MKKRIQKKILQKRKQLLDAVVMILDEIDPMGLLYAASKAGFSLEQKYEPEAKDLVARLDDKMGPSDIEKELKRIFDRWFHFADIPGAFYTAAARKIMNARLSCQGKPGIEFPNHVALPSHREPIIVEVDE